jgi:hypothetical protein
MTEKIEFERDVDHGPRTWDRQLTDILIILENGDDAGRTWARGELRRMAAVADQAGKWAPVVSRANALVDLLRANTLPDLAGTSVFPEAVAALDSALGDA